MRGSTVKKIKKFGNRVWNNTPEHERTGTLKHFFKIIKQDWINGGVGFQIFVKTI